MHFNAFEQINPDSSEWLEFLVYLVHSKSLPKQPEIMVELQIFIFRLCRYIVWFCIILLKTELYRLSSCTTATSHCEMLHLQPGHKQ